MRNSLYNPFMPSLLFKDRVVYGGGGGGGGEAAPAPEPEPVVDPEKFTSTFPELKGQEYNTQEEVNSAEKKVLEERRIKEEAATAKKEADEYATSTSADLDAASKKVRDKIIKLNLELQQLLQQDQTNPDIKAAVEAKRKEIGVAQEEAAAIGQGQGAQLSGAQQEMVKKSLTDPGSLAKKAEVAAVDPATQGTSISKGTGQVSGPTPYIDPATAGEAATAKAPSDVTAATVDTTTVADKAAEEAAKVKGAKGEVSDEAQVKAAKGELSKEAMADAATMDPDYIKEAVAGERTVSSEELAVAQGLDEEAVKADIAQTNVPDNIKAAQTSVQPEEIPKPAKIAESEMAAAEAMTMEGLSDDATAVAAKLKSFNVDDGTLAEFKEGKIEAQDTVQGQLSNLMKQFDDGTPAWAAGAMRAANSAMAARGLGSSSMAGSAILQAAMESALPIAAQDAEAFRTMKMDNLNRQQQISLTNAAAQQGVELANFNAEQQTALQNSQNAFALQSQNLSNMQQTVIANAQIKASLQGQNLSNQQQANMAEAARYAEVNNINLNNRQQGILQDNANQMQVNMANLNAKQQAYLANAQLEAALQGKKIDNKQQVAMANAARYADAANLTFTAKQQAEIHNSELMKTIGLAELNSKQAATLQNAAQIASMDMANLSNQQQAAVQNAQAFLQMDMTNLNNEQQASMFKAQAMQQALLTDAAAENATKQFNASSENQTNQFMASLKAQTSQFNASQKNAMSQFNTGEINAAKKFNAELKNQRDQFNANNQLVVAQANAQWRQNVATINTAAQNEANRQHAMTSNAMTQSTMDQIWQRERDLMSMAWKSSESAADRANAIILTQMSADAQAAALKAQNDASNRRSMGRFFGSILFGGG